MIVDLLDHSMIVVAKCGIVVETLACYVIITISPPPEDATSLVACYPDVEECVKTYDGSFGSSRVGIDDEFVVCAYVCDKSTHGDAFLPSTVGVDMDT